jgi:hypothetical protein
MNPETNRPEENEELLSLESKLRKRSLGSGPTNRNKLMYECGYAAGAADASRKLRQAKSQWRLVGIAASFVACLSLFSSIKFDESGGESRLGNRTKSLANESRSTESSSNTWILHLTKDRQREQQADHTLRASEDSIEFTNSVKPSSGIKSIPSEGNNNTLRPKDFPLFL